MIAWISVAASLLGLAGVAVVYHRRIGRQHEVSLERLSLQLQAHLPAALQQSGTPLSGEQDGLNWRITPCRLQRSGLDAMGVRTAARPVPAAILPDRDTLIALTRQVADIEARDHALRRIDDDAFTAIALPVLNRASVGAAEPGLLRQLADQIAARRLTALLTPMGDVLMAAVDWPVEIARDSADRGDPRPRRGRDAVVAALAAGDGAGAVPRRCDPAGGGGGGRDDPGAGGGGRRAVGGGGWGGVGGGGRGADARRGRGVG